MNGWDKSHVSYYDFIYHVFIIVLLVQLFISFYYVCLYYFILVLELSTPTQSYKLGRVVMGEATHHVIQTSTLILTIISAAILI